MMLRYARYTIALYVSFGCTISAFAQDPLKIIVEGISAGRVYRVTERVEVVVMQTPPPAALRDFDPGPVRFIAVGIERKGKDGRFQGVRYDVECPCNAKCCGDVRKLAKGEQLRVSWDFMTGDCERAECGTYRFAIIDRFSDASGTYVYHGVSQEFELAE